MNAPAPDIDSPPTRLLLVEDHPIVREGYVQLLSQDESLHVCGDADSVDKAIELIKTLNPDLLIVDISLDASNGLDLMKQVRNEHPDLKMLVVSAHDESLFAERALQAGALGYVNKQEATSRLLDAIRCVLDGKIFLSDRVIHRTLHRVGRSDSNGTSPVERLSNRELQVFELIGEGMTTREVANRLNLSPKTIETHRENIKSKMNLKNGAELTRHAVQWVLEKG